MRKAIETAAIGGITGGGMALSRLGNDPDGWAQVWLAIGVFALAGGCIGVIALLAQAWRLAAHRPRRRF